tara:strand:+ start:685 stop:1029 length:345 start_codon:yes stop_codon:yes gene_type:complete
MSWYDTMNETNTYNIIHLLSLKATKNIEPAFAGAVHIKFHMELSSDKERCQNLLNHLTQEDRLVVSDGYVYPVFECGNSIEKKTAYASQFCKLCAVAGVAADYKVLPYNIAAEI